MVLDVKQIKKRYKKAETHKDQWRSIYEEAYEYALPMRNLYDGYYEGNVPGQNECLIVRLSTQRPGSQTVYNPPCFHHNVRGVGFNRAKKYPKKIKFQFSKLWISTRKKCSALWRSLVLTWLWVSFYWIWR